MRALAPREGGVARCGSSLPHLSLSLSLSCASQLTAESPFSSTAAGRAPAAVLCCPRAGGFRVGSFWEGMVR
jgi:hypothetical protein